MNILFKYKSSFLLIKLHRFVLPIEASVIIVWWAIDLIDGESGDNEKWYEFGRETFIMTITQVKYYYLIKIHVIKTIPTPFEIVFRIIS